MFTPLPATHVPELRRQAWGRLFGLGIRASRTETGMSIEEAASLSGIEVSEWMAIEDGHVPQQVVACALSRPFSRSASRRS
jgi:hypothetical protein